MYKVTQSEGFLNLSLNENYLSFCQENIVELKHLNRYPNTSMYKQITQQAGMLYGVDSKTIMLTNGSDDGIFLIQQWFAHNARLQGKPSCFGNLFNNAKLQKPAVIITDPTFSMYEKYANNLGLDVIKKKLDDNLLIDVNGIIDCIAERSNSLVFLPNPNSPTGTVLSLTEIERIIQTSACVVVDEAYIEFSSANSATCLLNKYSNLIVLRTLSKFYGLAGVRMGFIIAGVATEIAKFQAPFSVSAVNAEIALKTLEYINGNTAKIIDFADEFKRNREDFIQKLSNKNNVIKVYNTEANFVLFEAEDVLSVIKKCVEKKFLIKDFTGTLPNVVRVTLASKEINEEVLECI